MIASVPPEHFGYVSDHVRTRLYRKAFEETVVPKASVLDLGCGVGVLGLLCLQAGAGRVMLLDRGPVVAVARGILETAGGSGMVAAVRGESHEAALSEDFDLIVCDHVGYFGFDYGIIGLLADARERFLKRGGALVPAAIEPCLAAVQAPRERARVDASIAADAPPALDMLHPYAINSKHAAELRPEDVLSDVAALGLIDLRTARNDPLVFSALLRIERPGLLDGLAGWFECMLSETVRMTNSPLESGRITRPQAFLPIAEPIEVRAGEAIRADLVARPDEGLLAWTVLHEPSGRRFRHSTFDGMIVGEDSFRQSRPDHAPRPTARARARAIVLGYCDGRRSRCEIKALVLTEHPALFPTRDACERFIAEVLDRDTE